MKICREPLIKVVELIEIFVVGVLFESVAFAALFIDPWDIIFVEDMMVGVQGQKRFHAPLNIGKMPGIVSKVSRILFHGKLFVDLT